MKKQLLILLATCGLALTACDSFFNQFNILPTDNSQSTGVKDLESTFINSVDGQIRYVTLNKNTLTLIPGETFQIKLDIYKEGETPNFSGDWENVEYGSENNSIASINPDGLLTANGVGTTRVFGKMFSTVGAYCTVNVIAKELESIAVTNARKTYVLDSEFSPIFSCVASFVGGHQEIVTPTSVDYSAVNTAVEGTYTVNVSYTFEDVSKSTSYEVKVIDNPTYEAKDLLYTSNDLYRERTFGWYCPNSGTVKSLTIPVYFTDTDGYLTEEGTTKAKVITDLRKAFYGEEGADGWNSVKTYYNKVSGGKLSFSGTVSDWYEPGYSSAYVNSQERINNLVSECVNWYFTEHKDDDIRAYDSDNNGVFDSLNIIYGCPDQAHGLSLYWGKISSQSMPIVDRPAGEPDVKFHMWASFAELYQDNMNSEVDSHVYCHETGHTFGLEDYYDYTDDEYEFGDMDYRPIGGSTMMFHNTHQQDPFSTLTLGWTKVIVPETSCIIELDDYQSSHQVILLSPNPESANSPFDEYILVELYAPNGVNEFDTKHQWRGYYSAGPAEAGIRLWHVDARIAEQVGETYVLTDDVMTSNPSSYAFSNSWGSNHGSVMGSDYYDNCLLFELRNDKTLTYRPTTDDENVMTSDMTLFHSGDVFTMSDYSSQFIKGTKLNNGKDLGWKISIETIVTTEGGYKATINLEQL
ncbi:MAG: hypothetical protein J5880_03310 [Bacilli bacterium]|nr:hypothetical protein [Bacilli bacterium]